MKKNLSLSLKNATIDLEDMTITEYTKDDSETFSLINDVLSMFDGIDGVSISIKKENAVMPKRTEEDYKDSYEDDYDDYEDIDNEYDEE